MLDRFRRDTRAMVLPLALAMIVVQSAFRAWASFGGWFQVDDLVFGSRVLNEHLLPLMFSGHNSHLMPAGFLATWLNFKVAGPWTYWPFAAELALMQVVANVGILVFLLSAFGRRIGILPPLALYLFTVFLVPSDLWWAVGINQLPTVAAFGWGGWAMLRYLRTHSVRWAAVTVGVTVGALAFQERALLLEVFYAFLALAYFSSGDIVERIKDVVRRYRIAVIAHTVLVLGYVALYVKTALSFTPGNSTDQPLLPLFDQMGLHGVVPAALGGPLRWLHLDTLSGFPAPPEILVWPCVALLGVLAYSVGRSRVRGARAWWLVGAVFGAQVVLVAASRAYIVGPQLGRDYRYTTEMGPTLAIALALALLPLIGAREQVERRQQSALFDHPWRVSIFTVIVVALGTYSTVPFVRDWNAHREGKTFFTNAIHDLEASKEPVALVDAPLPDNIWDFFAFSYPKNMESHLLRPWSEKYYFPSVVTDQLNVLARDGHLKPALISTVRQAERPSGTCAVQVRNKPADVTLDGPVLGVEWWVRASYTAESAGTIDIIAGDEHHRTTIEPGVHSLFFTAQGDGFDSISFQRGEGTGNLCVSDLTLGQPYAVGDKAPQ